MNIAINGFGRIGRTFYHANNNDLPVLVANDLGDVEQLKYLLKYDSVYGQHNVDSNLTFLAEKDPSKLPWEKMGIELVVESTGFFTKKADANAHIKAGAKKVIISAPSEDADVTIVMGVNEEKYDRKEHNVISMGSCTTNCLAPIAYAINKEFVIEKGWMTTVHSYTADQNLVDGPHKKDPRRGRSAALNIVPTSTGAAKAISQVIPDLKGKMHGIALRVPTPTVSVVELICLVKHKTTKQEVNDILREYARGKMQGILSVNDEPLVSSDLRGSAYSSIVDSELTEVVDGNLIHLTAWYDNEMGYSNRLVDLCKYISKKG
jgi:glyceraldehyde 3-phosphate dehydrogenase